MINIAQETLGLRRFDFSSNLSLLMPRSSLPPTPDVLTVALQCEWNAPLPYRRRNDGIPSFGGPLKPRYIFGAETLGQ